MSDADDIIKGLGAVVGILDVALAFGELAQEFHPELSESVQKVRQWKAEGRGPNDDEVRSVVSEIQQYGAGIRAEAARRRRENENDA